MFFVSTLGCCLGLYIFRGTHCRCGGAGSACGCKWCPSRPRDTRVRRGERRTKDLTKHKKMTSLPGLPFFRPKQTKKH